jgi:hypothetical protein
MMMHNEIYYLGMIHRLGVIYSTGWLKFPREETSLNDFHEEHNFGHK